MKPNPVLALILFFVCIFINVSAQEKGRKARVGKDEVPIVAIPGVDVNTKMSKEERRKYMQRVKDYEKLRRNIRLVLPLAKQCAKVINDVNAEIKTMDTRKDKKYFMDRLEKELFQKYEHQIKRMTVSQGKLLLKLIYRETDNSAYALIEEYRSWRSAAFWQMVARLFGSNLKEQYDPQQEVVIETIVKQIESGEDEGYKVTYHD